MSLSPGLFENEDGEGNNLPFGDSDNAVWSMIPSPATNAGPTIRFTNTSLGTDPNSRIINTADVQHTISWDFSPGVSITKAAWQVKDGDDISFANNGQQSMGSRMIFLNDNKVQLEVGRFKNEPDLQKLLAQYMYIKVYWTKDGRPGSTTSGVFTVYDNSNLPVAYPELNARLAREMSRSDQNVGVDTDDSVGNGDFNPENTLSSVTATATVTPTSSPSGSSDLTSGGPSENPNVEAGSGGGGGGLPAGAIAGIVVGVVLGIGLIAFLLWFFLRRRRHAEHGSNGAYGSGQGPHEYLADKETHARVTESPQSPYSDDGQHQQQPQPHLAPSQQEAAIPPSSATPAGRPSFAPYEEHTPIAARSLDDVNRGSGARSSTPNVNSNVSHLIEDGMTEDEIRRLEEEERALDAAIEQAGQTQGQRR